MNGEGAPMDKRRAVWAVTASALAFAGLVIACEEDTSSTFNETSPDRAIEGGSFFNTDSSTPADGAAGSCSPSLASSFTPAWNAPTRAASPPCSTAALGEYFDRCLDPTADAGACQPWKTSNVACTQCIEPANNAGPVQRYPEHRYTALNVAGCLAVARGDTSGAGCGAAFSASVECQREACFNCLDQGAGERAFRSCQAQARDGVCQTYEGQVTPKCGVGYQAPDAGAYACFQQPGDTLKSQYVRLMGVFCGP